MANRYWEQNKEATIYVGNLDERFTEPLMWEIMTQMGPVVNVHMPMDRVSRQHQGFGFVEFDTPESADYASRCLNGVRLFGKPLRVNKASADRQRATDIGAELFVNNLDPQIDEKILYDTFTQFGRLVAPPNVVRDQNNVSKGYGFVNFDSFEASDAALESMHGQYILNKQISVEYAYKKDGKGERHGDEAERKLAAEGKKHNVVPEIQPLPPAFLMNRSSAPPGAPGANILPPTGPAADLGGGPMANGNGVPNGMPMAAAANGMPSPVGGGFPPNRGPVPYHGGRQNGYGGGGGGGAPPPLPAGFGGGRGMGRGLPTAPSGLPARPPPGGVGGGAGGPPGFRGGPPAGFATGANSVGLSAPGAPGQGYNGMPPPPPPAGFARR